MSAEVKKFQLSLMRFLQVSGVWEERLVALKLHFTLYLLKKKKKKENNFLDHLIDWKFVSSGRLQQNYLVVYQILPALQS